MNVAQPRLDLWSRAVAGSSPFVVGRVLPVGDAPHSEPLQAEVVMLETDRRGLKAVAALMESVRADG